MSWIVLALLAALIYAGCGLLAFISPKVRAVYFSSIPTRFVITFESSVRGEPVPQYLGVRLAILHVAMFAGYLVIWPTAIKDAMKL